MSERRACGVLGKSRFTSMAVGSSPYLWWLILAVNVWQSWSNVRYELMMSSQTWNTASLWVVCRSVLAYYL